MSAWLSSFVDHVLTLIDHGHAVTAAAVVGIAWGAINLLKTGVSAFFRAATTRWWDRSPRSGAGPSWPEVLRLVRYGDGAETLGVDPLAFRPGIRGSGAMVQMVLRAVALCGVVVPVTAAAWAYVIHPFVPAIFEFGPNGAVTANAALNLSGNLTALLALLAASVSIAFTYHQLRAKVRADNR